MPTPYLNTDEIAAYLCVGDSMSIDLYPYLELAQTHPNVSKAVGAASLLYKNNSQLWPEFEGKDLVTALPNLKFLNIASDGATTYDFMEPECRRLLKDFGKQPLIATVTLCGNDLLNTMMRSASLQGNIAQDVRDILKRFEQVMHGLAASLPRTIFILNSVYDPSDKVGDLPGFPNFKNLLGYLDQVNEGICAYAAKTNALFADVHTHFLGHGLSAPREEQWYWEPNPIEPSARGASEIRRLWWQLLNDEDILPGH